MAADSGGWRNAARSPPGRKTPTPAEARGSMGPSAYRSFAAGFERVQFETQSAGTSTRRGSTLAQVSGVSADRIDVLHRLSRPNTRARGRRLGCDCVPSPSLTSRLLDRAKTRSSALGREDVPLLFVQPQRLLDMSRSLALPAREQT